jgi:hypothetical protein
LYLTVELAREDDVRAANEEARASGLPVIEEDAEGPWHEEGYAYHHVLARQEPR